jgi:hypothetical protein
MTPAAARDFLVFVSISCSDRESSGKFINKNKTVSFFSFPARRPQNAIFIHFTPLHGSVERLFDKVTEDIRVSANKLVNYQQ